jgi:hypothetical protein
MILFPYAIEKYKNILKSSCKVPNVVVPFTKFVFQWEIFCKVPNSIFTKIRPVGAVLIYSDRQMDGQYQANKHSLLFMQIHLEMLA